MVYSMMYAPECKAPCPMCTLFLNSWNGTAINLRERFGMAVTARSPIQRLVEYKKHRGFTNLPCVSDMSGAYTRTYVNSEDAGRPWLQCFTRRHGTVCHFYSGEIVARWPTPDRIPRRPRPRPSLANVGPHARGPWHRLEPEARLPS
jgi:predicted dithiol-disulfide oxidoreductase (DUF899 family)